MSALAVGALLVTACSDSADKPAVSSTTTEPSTSETWAVNTIDCIDPNAAKAVIEGDVKIGTVLPMSGGTAALAFSPVAEGMKAYVAYANEKGLLAGHKLSLDIQDDQYNKELTPTAVNTLLDHGVDLITGIVGTDSNLVVRDVLNEECVPQLQALTGSPKWGDPKNYPWTTGEMVPYDIEAKVYAFQLKKLYPNGAKVALYNVNTEFGLDYTDTLKEVAKEYGLDIVNEQTVEATETAPPTAQLSAIAAARPDAIVAVPLGSQCPTFMKEVANVKAANAGWDPKVFITNTCASSLILGAAGAAADGLYTSNFIDDITNPEIVIKPKVKEYLDYMATRGSTAVATTAAAGWTAMEATVAMLIEAAKSKDGLSRASIINAARNFNYIPMLGREGVVMKTNGLKDAYSTQSLTVIRYNAADKTFTPIGDLITEFES